MIVTDEMKAALEALKRANRDIEPSDMSDWLKENRALIEDSNQLIRHFMRVEDAAKRQELIAQVKSLVTAEQAPE